MFIFCISFLLCAAISFTIPCAYAQPTSHKVYGYIYDNDTSAVSLGTPYFINLTQSNLTNRGKTVLPFIPNYYTYTFANAINGEPAIVRAWNATHYGEKSGNLAASSPGEVQIDVTINLTRDPEANVTIVTPSDNVQYNQTNIFNITANVTIFGADGTSCSATINFTNASLIGLNTGSASNSLGDISRLDSVNTSWQVKAFRQGYVNVSVNASCSNSDVHLWNESIDTLLNINISNWPPFVGFVAPTENDGAFLQDQDHAFVNVTITDYEETYGFVDWNYSNVLWMRFDHTNASGEGALVYGNSSYRHNATALGNAVQNQTGKFGDSYTFDGSGDYLNVNLTADLNTTNETNWTWSAWVRTTSVVDVTQTVMTNQNLGSGAKGGLQMWQAATSFVFRAADSDGTANAAAWTGAVLSTWYHVVGVYNGTNPIIYVNGTRKHVGNAIELGYTTRNYTISASSSNSYKGNIDEVIIFNRALNDSEILALYNTSANRLFRNFTDLAGTYTYTAYAVDTLGAVNKTTRTLSVNNPLTINYNYSDPASPVEGQSVYIYANVTDDLYNITWVNFTVTAPNGTIILNNQNASSTTGDLFNSSSFSASAIGVWNWNITASDGYHTVNTTGWFRIPAWHIIYGNVSGKLTLENVQNLTLIEWDVENVSGSNIFISDKEATLSFNSLKALGRSTANEYQQDDFEDLDTILNMTDFPDSVNDTYTTSGSPNATANFTVFGSSLINVSIVNTTNSSNFTTGILWDTDDDDSGGGESGEFDSTDKEDICFITQVNYQAMGAYGTYDFEIRIPGYLRKYDATDSSVVYIYAEIK